MIRAATSPEDFRILITEKLKSNNNSLDIPAKEISTLSAVLMPLMQDKQGRFGLLLTKRSTSVAQPGDYCFPGGHINTLPDHIAATVFSKIPLPCFQPWRFLHNSRNRSTITLAAAALREAWEEVRLNPLKIRMLGELPPRELVSFKKTIYPFAAWTDQTENFRLNHEVKNILRIKVEDLLKNECYSALNVKTTQGQKKTICFIPPGDAHFIWGATLFIILDFLNTVFGFTPPEREGLARREYTLPAGYLREEGVRYFV